MKLGELNQIEQFVRTCTVDAPKATIEDKCKICKVFNQKLHSLKLAAVMLVKNQEAYIKDVLTAIQKTDVDEIVVVDTGSTDGTLDLVEKLFPKVKLYHEPWVENYGEMRNKAATYTTADWILTIDSDEIIENTDKTKNLKVLLTWLSCVINEPFSIEFEQHYNQRSDFGQPERLYSCANSHFFGFVHEEVRTTTNKPIRKILTNIRVINYGVEEVEDSRFHKSERYGNLLYHMILLEPNNPRWVSFISYADVCNGIIPLDFDKVVSQHLFAGDFHEDFDENRIKIHEYTQQLLEKYTSYLIARGELNEVYELAVTGLTLFQQDSYLLFFKYFSKIEFIKKGIRSNLKSALKDFVDLDDDFTRKQSHQDAQLLQAAIAKLLEMNGDYNEAKDVAVEITDIRARSILKGWFKDVD